jgi:hypothetical protein
MRDCEEDLEEEDDRTRGHRATTTEQWCISITVAFDPPPHFTNIQVFEIQVREFITVVLIFQCSQNLGEEINGKGYECPGSGYTGTVPGISIPVAQQYQYMFPRSFVHTWYNIIELY